MDSSNYFEHCVFLILFGTELSKERAAGHQENLEKHGGEVKLLKISSKINFGIGITHIISATNDFPQFSDADEYMIPVVKPEWILASIAKGKLAPNRPFTTDPSAFFSNLVVSCADIPTSDKDAIIGAVIALGGTESSSVTKQTTHICALTMDHPKVKTITERGLKTKIILPHWFDDCLRLGQRIDEKPYLLPNPDYILKSEEQTPVVITTHMEGATSAVPTSSDHEACHSARPVTVFKNKAVMISQDLEIRGSIRTIIENLIKQGGGTITTSVRNSDIYVCKYREGRDYVTASRAKKDVGNLSWLYFLITHNEWTSPLRRLLHYPLPRDPLPGFQDLRITLSNYGGDARTYLENLVEGAGASFTKSMKQDNTHLITARNTSEKCDAAREWRVEMVNHLWIEESYARCEAQKLSDPRYTHFPSMTNLGEIVGRTAFDMKCLERNYFPRDPSPDPNDIEPISRSSSPEQSISPSSRTTPGDVVMGGTTSNVESEEDYVVVKKPKKEVLKQKPRSSSSLLSTPARRIHAGKENDTPSSTNSRSAKDKALNKIHDLGPDLALYELEKKRKGTVWGGERAANRIDKERSSSPVVEKEDRHEVDEPRKKRVKTTGKLQPATIRLLITGYTGWLGAPTKEEAEKKKLRELGILVVQDGTTCTHLAAPALVRTKKFLCAIAVNPVIVSCDFIDYCVKHGEIPDVEDFLLVNKESEKRYKTSLKDISIRAKANKRSLLSRVPVYCTELLPNGHDTYKPIVEANGGTFLVYRGRGAPTLKPTKPEEDDGPAEPAYLLSGTRPEERKLWPKFKEMAEAANMIPRIVTTEWLLDVALSQQLKWDKSYLAKES